jgi:hypothetical protein
LQREEKRMAKELKEKEEEKVMIEKEYTSQKEELEDKKLKIDSVNNKLIHINVVTDKSEISESAI